MSRDPFTMPAGYDAWKTRSDLDDRDWYSGADDEQEYLEAIHAAEERADMLTSRLDDFRETLASLLDEIDKLIGPRRDAVKLPGDEPPAPEIDEDKPF